MNDANGHDPHPTRLTGTYLRVRVGSLTTKRAKRLKSLLIWFVGQSQIHPPNFHKNLGEGSIEDA